MPYTIKQTIYLVKNHIIGKTKNRDTQVVQVFCPLHISDIYIPILMYFTIKFYTEFQLIAKEIKNISTYWMLSTEMVTDLILTQILPQNNLCRRHISPQLTRQKFITIAVVSFHLMLCLYFELITFVVEILFPMPSY